MLVLVLTVILVVYHYIGSGSGIDNCISCGNDGDGWRSRKKEKRLKQFINLAY